MPTKTTAPARYTAVVLDEPTTPMDAQQVWRLIGADLRMRIGSHDEMFSTREYHYAQFDVRCDGSTKRRFLVTLAPDDTYSVEVGRTITRRGPRWGEWVSIDVVRGVYADTLREVVESLYVKAYGG